MIKKRRAGSIFRALLWAVSVAIASGSGTAAAQSPEPKTVADFFLLVPERSSIPGFSTGRFCAKFVSVNRRSQASAAVG